MIDPIPRLTLARRVVGVGSETPSGGNGAAELYDPGSGSWTATGSMTLAQPVRATRVGLVAACRGWENPLSDQAISKPSSPPGSRKKVVVFIAQYSGLNQPDFTAILQVRSSFSLA